MRACLGTRKNKAGDTVYILRWTAATADGLVKLKNKTIGTNRKDARDALAAKRVELRRTGGVSGGWRLSDLRAELAVWMAHRSPVTRRKTQASIGALIGVVGDLELDRLDRRAVMVFRGRRMAADARPATVNKDLRQIKSALSYAVDAGWLAANPLLRWRDLFVREPETQIRVVEPAEFAVLLTGTTWNDLQVMLQLAYYEGLRRAELCHLRWVDVDLAGGTLAVVNRAGELTKSRRNRILPLRRSAAEALAAHLERVPKLIEDGRVRPRHEYLFCWDDGSPLKPDWVTHQFEACSKASGVACTLHDLRRSFSTLAQRAGVDRSLVKDMGGWSCLSVVEKHYSGELGEAYRRAARLMDGAG